MAAAKAPAKRLIAGYVVLVALFALVAVVSLRAGASKQAEPAIDGRYSTSGSCLDPTFELKQSGQFVTMVSGGSLRLANGILSGNVACRDASTDTYLRAIVSGTGLRGDIGGEPFEAKRIGPGTVASAATCGESALSPELAFGRLMLAIAVVILVARLMGAAVAKIGQPRVMGEVLAGILLGPSLLGIVAPCLKAYLFPVALIPPGTILPIGALSGAADIGLAFYMFLVGLELDPRMLRGRVSQAAFISNASVLLPLALGMAVAVPLYVLVGGSPAGQDPLRFAPFALFLGVAMSITAFPVLARILLERRMMKRPVGAMSIAAAAVDDVTAWCLLALATGVAASGGPGNAIRVVVLAIVFSAAMALVGRRILAKVSTVYDEAGHIPAGWMAAIFIGILLSAYVSTIIGIAAIFGAFVMGLIMPRRADLTKDITRRIETFVSFVLLPLFFVVTGLRTQIGSLDRPELWLITLLLVAVAIVGKFVGATAAARYAGIRFRDSAAIGALMNTRGLTELIVLNVGLDLHVINPTLFTMLVIMALVTTFMTGPLMKLIDPRGELTAPAEEELRKTEPATEKAILTIPVDRKNLPALLAIAEPLARSRPPREIVLAQLVEPSRVTSFISVDDRHLAEASAELAAAREALIESGVAARSVAFIAADQAEDLVRLAAEQEVDLLLIDGAKPLLGEAVPRGTVGAALEKAPCDVAVLIEKFGRAPQIGPGRPVVIPFGGADHDWAALELASWIASAKNAPLRMLGAAADLAKGERDASRLLANASLVLQKLTGVAAEPVVVDRGSKGVLEAAEGAGLLIIGLSERWKSEGLGEVRSTIAKQAGAPVLFVRRGSRAGALAAAGGEGTRFAWSAVGPR